MALFKSMVLLIWVKEDSIDSYQTLNSCTMNLRDLWHLETRTGKHFKVQRLETSEKKQATWFFLEEEKSLPSFSQYGSHCSRQQRFCQPALSTCFFPTVLSPPNNSSPLQFHHVLLNKLYKL